MSRRTALLLALAIATISIWAAFWYLLQGSISGGPPAAEEATATVLEAPTATSRPPMSLPQTSDEVWLRCSASVIRALADAGQAAEDFAILGAQGDSYRACDRPVERMAERSGAAIGLLDDCTAPTDDRLLQAHRHLSSAVDYWALASAHVATFCYTGAASELAEATRCIQAAVDEEEDLVKLIEQYGT